MIWDAADCLLLDNFIIVGRMDHVIHTEAVTANATPTGKLPTNCNLSTIYFGWLSCTTYHSKHTQSCVRFLIVKMFLTVSLLRKFPAFLASIVPSLLGEATIVLESTEGRFGVSVEKGNFEVDAKGGRRRRINLCSAMASLGS